MVTKNKTSKSKSASRLSKWSSRAKLMAKNALSRGKSLVKNPKLFFSKKSNKIDDNEETLLEKNDNKSNIKNIENIDPSKISDSDTDTDIETDGKDTGINDPKKEE